MSRLVIDLGINIFYDVSERSMIEMDSGFFVMLLLDDVYNRGGQPCVPSASAPGKLNWKCYFVN